MSTVGRQRPGAPAAHHQRQHSDNFLESSSNGRWLQSTGNPQRTNVKDQASPNESSPGLLDLHSFDTELLPTV